jgi:hypothetical protein
MSYSRVHDFTSNDHWYGKVMDRNNASISIGNCVSVGFYEDETSFYLIKFSLISSHNNTIKSAKLLILHVI